MEVLLTLYPIFCHRTLLKVNLTGGYTFGQAYDRVYNPVGLVQESVASGHPVLYVATNYRVGSMPLRPYMTVFHC